MADKIMVSYGDSVIRESDFKLLQEGNWINDSVIAFWFEYLQTEKYKDSNILFVSPQIGQLIKMAGNSEIPIFLDPLNVKSQFYLLVPVNDCVMTTSSGGSHWSLLICELLSKTWYHIDSHSGSNLENARIIAKKIHNYISNNQRINFKEACCTQQTNGFDCGAFVMLYAAKLAEQFFNKPNHLLDYVSCFVEHVEATQIRKEISKILHTLKKK